METRIFATLLFLISAIACAGSTSAQGLRDLFPEAFLEPQRPVIAPVRELLQLDEAQMERYWDIAIWRHDKPDPRQLYTPLQQFELLYEVLNPEQKLLYEKYMITDYYTDRIAFADGMPQHFEWAIALHPKIADFLNLSGDQRKTMLNFNRRRISEGSALREKVRKELESKLILLYERWQKALFEELLSHQQAEFEESVGKPFQIPKSISDVLQFHDSPRRFNGLDPDRASEGVLFESEDHPGEVYMFATTPRYLDAHKEPYSLLYLLLDETAIKELRINPLQQAELTRLQKRLKTEQPLTGPFKVKVDKSERLTSKKQREIEALSFKEYGEFEAKILAVLDPRQRERLNQIWNQFVLNFGWQYVPLTFPDYIPYLELPESQKIRFDQINETFQAEAKELQRELNQQLREFQTDHAVNRKIGELLTNQQKALLSTIHTQVPQGADMRPLFLQEQKWLERQRQIKQDN